MATAPHPFDVTEFAQKLSVIRTVCLGMMVILAGIAFGFSLVVYFALDGIALAGNMLSVGGVSILAIGAGVLTPFVPLVAWKVGQSKRAAGVRKLVDAHPEVIGSEAETEGLLDAYAGGKFTEYAIATGVGFVWAIVFHVISSPLMLAWIAVLIGFLAVRFPTVSNAKSWYNKAAQELIRLRDAKRNLS